MLGIQRLGQSGRRVLVVRLLEQDERDELRPYYQGVPKLETVVLNDDDYRLNAVPETERPCKTPRLRAFFLANSSSILHIP